MSDDCLDCPDEQNYAAIHLQLQETALQAEACLYEVETALRQVTNFPTILFTTTGAVGAALQVLTRIGTGIGTTTFANSPRGNMVATTTPWEPGVWEVGAYINITATGAVTPDTYRELYIKVHDIGTNTDVYTTMVSMTEPNDGLGTDMVHTTTVILEANQEIRFYVRHNNTGSSVNVNIGALYWATRLSDPTALRVV